MIKKFAKILEIFCSILVVTTLIILIFDNFEDIIPNSQRTQLYLNAILNLVLLVLLRTNNKK